MKNDHLQPQFKNELFHIYFTSVHILIIIFFYTRTPTLNGVVKGVKTLQKLFAMISTVVESFAPHIVILQLGTNDLSHLDSLVTASAMEDLVGILYNEHSVQQISVCQTLNRKNDAAFNARVKALTKYLKVLLTPIPWCFLGGHRSFWNISQRYFTRDAVHLNKLGHYKYDQSLRGGLLKSLHSWACSVEQPN